MEEFENNIYYNDIITDIASLDAKDEVINYLKRVNDDKLGEFEWQDILDTAAEKFNISVNDILAELEEV